MLKPIPEAERRLGPEDFPQPLQASKWPLGPPKKHDFQFPLKIGSEIFMPLKDILRLGGSSPVFDEKPVTFSAPTAIQRPTEACKGLRNPRVPKRAQLWSGSEGGRAPQIP